ncbi:Homeobox-like_domain superfamily [Hexamita inflata]|uniref:Homeobox-like domain superfamily n=1 Tax=Hexamita inflata TaxID=28002 RepID=A0AA86NCX4_9EUKA|nr:Homeobox-like domain superfamily [Hexamita inflata]
MKTPNVNQLHPNVTNDIRIAVISQIALMEPNNQAYETVSKIHNISAYCVRRIWRCFINEGRYENMQKGGSLKKFNEPEQTVLINLAKQNSQLSQLELCELFQKQTGLQISRRTAMCILKEQKLEYNGIKKSKGTDSWSRIFSQAQYDIVYKFVGTKIEETLLKCDYW